MDHNVYFTSGQFAKQHRINKRTLHYYDDIGLFSPALVGENGYRYYTYYQSPTLELILTLRELGMSVEEIKCYMEHRSPETFSQMIAKQVAGIDNTIRHLKELKKLLLQKEEQLKLCRTFEHKPFELVEYPREYLLLSQPISNTLEDVDFAVLTEHANQSEEHRLFNQSYGTMIPIEYIFETESGHERYFTRLAGPAKIPGVFIKPEGHYLRAFCRGSWKQLPDVYRHMFSYAAEHGLELEGHAYEEGLNEIAISDMDEYITQITILCVPKA